MGIFNVPSLPILSCSGSPFTLEWTRWRYLLQKSGPQDVEVQREGCIVLERVGSSLADEWYADAALQFWSALANQEATAPAEFCFLGTICAAYLCSIFLNSFDLLVQVLSLPGAYQATDILLDGGWNVQPLDIFKARYGSTAPLYAPTLSNDYDSGLAACFKQIGGYNLHVAVLGHHWTFALGVALEVEAAIGKAHFAFYGVFYAKYGQDKFGEVAQGRLTDAIANYHAAAGNDEIATALLEVGRALRIEDWRTPKYQSNPPMLWLSTENFAVGTLLRDALLPESVIIHALDGANLVLQTPENTQVFLLSRMVAMYQSAADAIVPLSRSSSIQINYLTGLSIPAVWFGARYVSPLHLVVKPERKRIIIGPTHEWLASMQGRLFILLLDSFCKRLGDDAPAFESWHGPKDLAAGLSQYSGVLYIPEDLFKIFFYEMYAFRMMTIVPDAAFLARVLPVVGCIAYFFCQVGLGVLQNSSFPVMRISNVTATKHPSLAEPPFDLAYEKHGHAKAWYWAHFADFSEVPHVVRFGSTSELLVRVDSTDIEKTRLGMHEYYESRIRKTVCDLRDKLTAVLDTEFQNASNNYSQPHIMGTH